MEGNEQYLSIDEIKQIMSDYPLQYIVCGQCAIDLFLNEYTYTKEIMSITVSREEVEILSNYFLKHQYQLVVKTPLDELEEISLEELYNYKKYYVYDTKAQCKIIKVYIYETKDEKWQFSHDHNIEVEDYKIYFHSLEKDIKYLRPEIQMMYKLYHELRQDDIYKYQRLIQHLSYYQFFMLRKVIGKEKVNQIILSDT
ncbi:MULTISPECIES: hypothetical protein [Mammaliicoccus]|uniref:Uncharacterized protein n=1 Tax=Mammaliicoccus fleurettii TaxID=150056 RepID=A0ABS5MPW3_9STAP|nr:MULTISPECIES: hypothetical protein [Mammaliicoccus]MBL0848108.1 hypothetical protein [Mammaliicoccus fleurettii]MBS3672820.1 hypothetical protein [Mammaliicoccus fleurettii]MBS3697968.1 hypothetical protein [Mammaliicoccus fleurettii]MBW0764624.1 hypothetical protein [Mammaliicoccus fleurettii]MEB6200699.1 hypothetical protein [Mammaliicoccus fleurettii]